MFFADIERFWGAEMGEVFGIEFQPVERRVPYEPTRLDSVPACADELGPLELYRDNAFYCPAEDFIAWDDVGLFPDLYNDFGDFAVGLVLAHEYSHAVQSRAEILGPTILVELQADCWAGAWAGDAATNAAVPVTAADLDNAIGGFLTFADPLGTPAGDPSAHGTAFDRLNSFVEGFENGPMSCTDYIVNPPQTTSLGIDFSDVNQGDLPLDDLLPIVSADMEVWLSLLAQDQLNAHFLAPGPGAALVGGGLVQCGAAAVDVESIEGSAFYCPADNSVYWDLDELQDVWSEAGDFAPAYAVAHSYVMSIASAFDGLDTNAAVLAADCLVGVWSRDVFDGSGTRERFIFLSAGDLDEGIVGLLLVAPTGPAAADASSVATFDRVAEFGRGFLRGISQCRLGG